MLETHTDKSQFTLELEEDVLAWLHQGEVCKSILKWTQPCGPPKIQRGCVSESATGRLEIVYRHYLDMHCLGHVLNVMMTNILKIQHDIMSIFSLWDLQKLKGIFPRSA